MDPNDSNLKLLARQVTSIQKVVLDGQITDT
jgi:hypothetical protein